MVVVQTDSPDNADPMKRNTTTKTMRRSLPVFAQIVQLIPPGLIENIAAACRIKARVFAYAHQVFALLLGQLSGAFSLNEICDAMAVHAKKLFRVRGLQPARRNTFSNANRTRDPSVAEKLFWEMHGRLTSLEPKFVHPKHKGRLARFRLRRIVAVDSSVLQLTHKAIDWAKHRRRKAAAKLHMVCDVASRMPVFACLTPAKVADCRRMLLLCANLVAGDIAVFDRAYNDFSSLAELDGRDVFYVVREKDGMLFEAIRRVPEGQLPANVLSDETIRLAGIHTSETYPAELRRIRARVEVDGKVREMVFLTNNFEWSATTVAELYRARWQVELLFKELKQTLQLKDFYGENEKAVAWQVWTAMLAHLLLRYLAYRSRWHSSQTRFAGVVKAALWERLDLMELLASHGTAPRPPGTDRGGETPCLPGFGHYVARTMGQHSA